MGISFPTHNGISPYFGVHRSPIIQWIKVWDDMPSIGDIVPVWDGDYMYYASYWMIDGESFFSICSHCSVNPSDSELRKPIGDKVYPLEWMKILPPNHDR